MFIYLIENTFNGKVMVGQTVTTVTTRWTRHMKLLRKGIHENPHLQNSWNKYGEDVWIINPIDTATCVEELNILEDFYIVDVFDSMNPERGYNLRRGGYNGRFSEESKKRMSEAQKKVAKVLGSDHYRRMSLKRWADPKQQQWRRDKNKEMFSDPVMKERIISKGILPYAVDSVWKSKLAKTLWKRDDYRKKFEKNYGHVKSPIGEIYEVQGLRKFSRKYDLDPSSLSRVCNGQAKQHKGWTKYE